MVLFAIGIMAGLALGMIIVGFLAIGAYDRGYSEALERRKAWRTELLARTVVGTRALVSARKASYGRPFRLFRARRTSVSGPRSLAGAGR